MTIKELYEAAVKHGVENYPVRTQFRDSGGDYSGDGELYGEFWKCPDNLYIDEDRKIVLV